MNHIVIYHPTQVKHLPQLQHHLASRLNTPTTYHVYTPHILDNLDLENNWCTLFYPSDQRAPTFKKHNNLRKFSNIEYYIKTNPDNFETQCQLELDTWLHLHDPNYLTLAPPQQTRIRHYTNTEKYATWLQTHPHIETLVFDLETSGLYEFREDAAILSISLTLETIDGEIDTAVLLKNKTQHTVTHQNLPTTIPLKTAQQQETLLDEIDLPVYTWLDYDTITPGEMKQIWDTIVKLKPRNIVAQNAKFDARWVYAWTGINPNVTFDTRIAAHLINENMSTGLKNLTEHYLYVPNYGIPINVTVNAKNPTQKWWHPYTTEQLITYNAADTYYTYWLYKHFTPILHRNKYLWRLFTKTLMPLSRILTKTEHVGIWLDQELLNKYTKECEQKLEKIEQELANQTPLNPKYAPNYSSTQYLQWFLYEYLELPAQEYTEKGLPSVAEATLKRYTHPVCTTIVEHSKLRKKLTSFYKPYQYLLHDSRLHTSFNITGTLTGRLSSGKETTRGVSLTEPGINMQQIPRDPTVRGLFGAPPGWVFKEFDYSQLELRLIASISGDAAMRQVYLDGGDIHMLTAMSLTGKTDPGLVLPEERTRAKGANFGLTYGQGAEGFKNYLWKAYQVDASLEEATVWRERFFDTYSTLLDWHEWVRVFVRKHGFVENLFGRRRRFPGRVTTRSERQAINSVIQSTGSDIMVSAIVAADRALARSGSGAFIVSTVHDSLQLQIPVGEDVEVSRLVVECMECAGQGLLKTPLTVPLVVDCKGGSHWV